MPKEDKKDKHVDYTTIDPLNLALNAKSPLAKLFWWFTTIACFTGLIAVIALLAVKYNSRNTTYVTKVNL